jgi:multiple sugar transport system substrate-binding protein
MRHSRRRLRWSLTVVVAVLAVLASACSSGPPGPPVLTWYINPDDGGQDEIASRCSEQSGGRYTIATSQLPREASEQREQLVRRLAAEDTSIDLMSLDPPYVAEFAQAGFLAPMPPEVQARAAEGVVPSALDGVTWQGQIVAVPFWANTQLLWYRKSMVAQMGLDMSQPVTWDQIIQAAAQAGTQVGAQGARAESLTVWLNALIESGDGSVIVNENETDPELVQLGLTAPPAVEAARIMRSMVDTGVAGPGFATQDEDATASAFQDGRSAFMVNWPFVWGQATSGVEEGTLSPDVVADYGWALYPQTAPGLPSAPPYGGINLGVGGFSAHPDLAYDATACIASVENTAYYMITNGNPAARTAVYDRPDVLEEFPMAPVIRESLTQAAPRPKTPYYAEVSEGLQRSFHPAGAIVPGPTNQSAQDLIQAVLAKEALL